MFEQITKIPRDVHTGFPITQAVVEGIQEGKIFAFENNYFIIHKSGFASFIYDTDCYSKLVTLLLQKKIPQYFHIYDAGDELISGINSKSSLFNTKLRKRVKLVYPYTTALILPERNDGFYSGEILEADFYKLDVFKLDLETRFWKNKREFKKNALVNVVFNDRKEPVSICYAAAVSFRTAEIDVATLEEARGKGLAKLAVIKFVNECIKKEIIPNWDCFEDNISSIKTAESLCFKKTRGYHLLSVFKNKL